MPGRTVLYSWLAFYLLLATPGCQLVLCWAGVNHFVLESSDRENCCSEDETGPFEFALDVVQSQVNCDCPPCIDIPLSFQSEWEPARKPLQPTVHEPLKLGAILSYPYSRIPILSLPRLGQIDMDASLPVSLITLRTVCLLI